MPFGATASNTSAGACLVSAMDLRRMLARFSAVAADGCGAALGSSSMPSRLGRRLGRDGASSRLGRRLGAPSRLGCRRSELGRRMLPR